MVRSQRVGLVSRTISASTAASTGALAASPLAEGASAGSASGLLGSGVGAALTTGSPDLIAQTRAVVAPLDVRNVDRRNAEGYLKTGKEMLAAADEVATNA